MLTTAEVSRNGTLPDTSHKQRFEQAVVQAAATMDAPPYNNDKGKLHKAMDLVLAGKVQAHTDGLYSVKDSTKTYDIDGECPCPQGQGQASKWCEHLVAVELWKRANEILYPVAVNGNGHHKDRNGQAEKHQPVNGTQPKPPTIPAQFITQIHGKDFVQYGGLLAMAHDRGLVSLKAHFISVNTEMAIAEATATFQDGRTFMECADATPANVNQKISPHFPRMALTRAKARALRDALNIGMTAVEELA